MRREGSFLPSPVSLLEEVSYVTISHLFSDYEGIRRPYPRGTVNLTFTVSLSDGEKRRLFPGWVISGLGLKDRGSQFILDRFMLGTEVNHSGQFSPT